MPDQGPTRPIEQGAQHEGLGNVEILVVFTDASENSVGFYFQPLPMGVSAAPQIFTAFVAAD